MPYNLSIPGQVSEYQLKAIEAVASLVPKGGKVVEVGSLFGRSSWAWAKSVDPSATVHCIDPWERNEGVRAMEVRYGITYGLEQFKRFTADCPNIKPMQGYSPKNFEDWSDPLDLYYEDAVHTDPVLAQNLAFWSSKLKPSGIVCGDDYRPRFPDVCRGAQALAEHFIRRLIRVDFFWCLLPEEHLLPGSDEVAERLGHLGRECDSFKRSRGPLFHIGPRKPLIHVGVGASPVVACRLANESLDPWPEISGDPITVGVRVTLEGKLGTVMAETRSALPVSELPPDVPIDFDLVLPLATLPEGRYRLIFDLIGPDGNWTISRAAECSTGISITLTKGRASLIDASVAMKDFIGLVSSDSHGAFDKHLGAGQLYYSIGTVVRSQVSVCIGSGGGFVPSLMRRAQIDADIKPAVTYLVDANLPDLAFGSPSQNGGWMTDNNPLLKREADIVILPMLPVDAARLFASDGLRIDHLHVDGDHSGPGFLSDLKAFLPLLSETGIVTFHDVRLPSVAEAVSDFRESNPDIEVLTFPEIGAGTGILRYKIPIDMPRRAQTRSDFVDSNRKTALSADRIAPAVAESKERSRFERWSYLKTEAYQTRYKLAASFVDQAERTIIEIGGFPNSVVSWLVQSKTAHLIEPYAPNSFVEEIEAEAKQRGIEAFVHRHPTSTATVQSLLLKPYNLIALGFDLSAGANGREEWVQNLSAFLKLVSNAERAVIEIPGYRASQLAWDHLSKILKPRIVGDITLDLSRDPVANEFHVKDSRSLRRLLTMEIDRIVDPNATDVQALVRLAADELAAMQVAATQPDNIRYNFGTPIAFHAGGESQNYTREGWVVPEARHRWMAGTASRLVLAAAMPAEGVIASASILLTMKIKPFVVPGKLDHQSLSLSVNGECLFEGAISSAMEIRITMPASLFFGDQPAEIVFLHPDAARPCDLVEGSTDRKMLSLAVHELCLTLLPL